MVKPSIMRTQFCVAQESVAHKMRCEMCIVYFVFVFVYATQINRTFWNFALYTTCCPMSDTFIFSVYPLNK